MFVTDAHTTDDLVYIWGGPSGGFQTATLQLAEFTFKDHYLEECSKPLLMGILYLCLQLIIKV